MTDTTTIDPVAMVEKWSQEQRQSVLLALTKKLLADLPGQASFNLLDERGRSFAHLVPEWDQTSEFETEFTPAFWAEVMRRIATSEDAVSWPEFERLLEEGAVAETTTR